MKPFDLHDLSFSSPDHMRFDFPAYEGCSFCDDLSGARPCVIVAQNERAVAQINERQYERGAMLVIPRMHRESILDILPEELEAVYGLAQEVARAAAVAFGAAGMNIFQNNGAVAGQSEPHFHVHVVPRYPGSDPARIFERGEVRAIPNEEQRSIAAPVMTALHAAGGRGLVPETPKLESA